MGKFYSLISNGFGIRNLAVLHFLSAFFLAVLIVYISYLFGKIVKPTLGLCFFFGSILSPWLPAFARDLYWSPWLWFLPLALCLTWYRCRENEQGWDRFFLVGVFLAFLIKCLSGYEYLTSTVLLASSIFLVAPFLPGSGYSWMKAFGLAIRVGVASVAAFIVSLLMHAVLRSDSLIDGLGMIWANAMARIHGDPVDVIGTNPLPADFSIAGVLHRYIFVWNGPAFPNLGARAFVVLNIIALVFVLHKAVRSDSTWKRDLGLWFILLSCPLSWLVLVKSHSYIHTHLNYVLWYFGFLQVVLFIVVDGCISLIRQIFKDKLRGAMHA